MSAGCAEAELLPLKSSHNLWGNFPTAVDRASSSAAWVRSG
jgi:hypothetical protein